VAVGVGVWVAVGVLVCVGVGEPVAVGEDVVVAVAVWVAVGGGVPVVVEVGVGVGGVTSTTPGQKPDSIRWPTLDAAPMAHCPSESCARYVADWRCPPPLFRKLQCRSKLGEI
jgi:hypothetical protein